MLQEHQVSFFCPERHLAIGEALSFKLRLPCGITVGILLGIAPVDGERRIGEHAVEVHQFATLDMLWLGQSVLVLQISGADAVQQHVHLGDGPHCAVELLPKQVSLAAVFTVFINVLLGRDQHAARATAGIVNVVLERGLN